MEADDELLGELGARPISYQDYVNVFKLHGDWLQGQPLEWRARFYGILADLDPKELIKAGLAEVACVPTDGGDLAVPNTTSVFYPLNRRRKYGFEAELTIIDSKLLDEASTHSSRVNDLFAVLKVKSDDPYDLVTSHILPRHKGDAWKHSNHKAIVGHLRYIKDKLSGYVEGARQAGKSAARALEAIREGIWVGTNEVQEDACWMFARAQDLYFSKEYKPQFCMETLLGEGIDKNVLVSAAYVSVKAKDAEAETESWRMFLCQIGVRVTPKLAQTPSGDWLCSSELQSLLDCPRSAVRKAALECLDQHWDEYAQHLRYFPTTRNSSVRDTQFTKSLQSMIAPTRRRATVPLAQSYYPNAEIKEVFGDKLPYVSAVLTSTGLLDACLITYRVDAKACLKRLEQLKTEGGDTTPQLHAIYRNLERCWAKEGAVIKQAFEREGLIRVKGSNSIWARPDEVTWRSNTLFLDSLYPPIQGQYRDFSGFFNDKLGIKDLSTAKRVLALSRLDEIESPDDRKHEAVAIYLRANKDLVPRFGKEEVQSPAWLAVFESEEVFLNHRDVLVSNDGNLFANDAPALALLFHDEEDISLLAIPFEDVPRVSRLIQAVQVQLLSKSVEVEVAEVSGGHVQSELTSCVRRALPFVARVLYAKEHDRFEAAVNNELFARLRDVEVVEVPELKLEKTLAGVTRETSADATMIGDRILLRAGARCIKDQLAAELCQFLGGSEELADTVSLLLKADDLESIEDFLQFRRIGLLPADVQASLTENAWTQPTGDESNSMAEETYRAVGSDEGVEWEVESEVSIPDVPVQTGSNAATRSRLEESPLGNPPTGSTRGGGGLLHPSGPGETQSGRQEMPQAGGELVTGPTRGPGAGVAGPTHSDGNSGEVSGLESTGQAPAPPSYQLAPPITADFRKSTGGPHNSLHPPNQGGAPQQRTKTGRLLSYAASPSGTERERERDSPEKAAARDAICKAAVAHFLATQSARWKSLTPMPHNNPGFDVKALTHEGGEEFIEIKGQSGAWTEEGVALTPMELTVAQRAGERYWLCVVEHVHDENRRNLYLVKNPFGLTDQFRFDSGWKSVAVNETVIPLKPEAGVVIVIPDDGRGRILSARKTGHFFKLHVILDGGGQVHRTFNPATMKLYTE